MPVYVKEFLWELTGTIVCTNVTSINNKYCSRFCKNLYIPKWQSINWNEYYHLCVWFILPERWGIYLKYWYSIGIWKNYSGEIIFLQDILEFSKDFQKFLQDWCLSKGELKVFLYKNLVLKGNAPLRYKISYCILKSDWRIFWHLILHIPTRRY